MTRTVRFALALSLAVPAVASAATAFDLIAEGLVVADATYPQGAGSPSVVWDADAGELVMYFETAVTAPGCDEAWAIGKATSADGLVWTPEGRVIAPKAGSAHPCGARHPAALIDGDGGRYLAFNVVDQVRDDQVAIRSVVGGARSTRIVPELDGIVAPTLARYEDEFVLLGIRSDPADRTVVSARSTDAVAWTLDADDAIPVGATPWALDGHLSPTLLCNDASSYEWELYYGGWTGVDTAWTWGISDNANDWYVTPAIETWSDDSAWQAWEAVKFGAATLVFYEDLDALGVPRINLAGTAEPWTAGEAKSRHCVDPS